MVYLDLAWLDVYFCMPKPMIWIKKIFLRFIIKNRFDVIYASKTGWRGGSTLFTISQKKIQYIYFNFYYYKVLHAFVVIQHMGNMVCHLFVTNYAVAIQVKFVVVFWIIAFIKHRPVWNYYEIKTSFLPLLKKNYYRFNNKRWA